MQNIQVKIESFGAIERKLPKDLTLECQASSGIADVFQHIEQLYPDARTLLERCACAIGEEIVPRQMLLTHDSTLIILSPVAGG